MTGAHGVDRLPGDGHRHDGRLAGTRRQLGREAGEAGVGLCVRGVEVVVPTDRRSRIARSTSTRYSCPDPPPREPISRISRRPPARDPARRRYRTTASLTISVARRLSTPVGRRALYTFLRERAAQPGKGRVHCSGPGPRSPLASGPASSRPTPSRTRRPSACSDRRASARLGERSPGGRVGHAGPARQRPLVRSAEASGRRRRGAGALRAPGGPRFALRHLGPSFAAHPMRRRH